MAEISHENSATTVEKFATFQTTVGSKASTHRWSVDDQTRDSPDHHSAVYATSDPSVSWATVGTPMKYLCIGTWWGDLIWTKEVVCTSVINMCVCVCVLWCVCVCVYIYVCVCVVVCAWWYMCGYVLKQGGCNGDALVQAFNSITQLCSAVYPRWLLSSLYIMIILFHHF